MPRLPVLILGLLIASATLADDPPPVQLGALFRGIAIPAQGRPDIEPFGMWRQRIDLDDVNEYAKRANASEFILFDGEAAQVSYTLRYGLGGGWELSLFVPLLVQGGGILDPIIQDWHRFWHLPNGGRNSAVSNSLSYQYSRSGRTILDVSQSNTSLGDVQLSSGYQITDHLAARAMLKLPTGNANLLSGDDALGGALWLDGGLPLENAYHRLTLYASIGCSFNGTGDILAAQQKRFLPFGSVGIGLKFTDRWDARLQIYVDAPAYKGSQLAPLQHIGVPLTLTSSYKFTPRTTLSIGIQEKLVFLASPDFGVHLGVALRR